MYVSSINLGKINENKPFYLLLSFQNVVFINQELVARGLADWYTPSLTEA